MLSFIIPHDCLMKLILKQSCPKSFFHHTPTPYVILRNCIFSNLKLISHSYLNIFINWLLISSFLTSYILYIHSFKCVFYSSLDWLMVLWKNFVFISLLSLSFVLLNLFPLHCWCKPSSSSALSLSSLSFVLLNLFPLPCWCNASHPPHQLYPAHQFFLIYFLCNCYFDSFQILDCVWQHTFAKSITELFFFIGNIIFRLEIFIIYLNADLSILLQNLFSL